MICRHEAHACCYVLTYCCNCWNGMCCVLPGCNNATCAVAVLPLDDSEGEASELAVAPGEFPPGHPKIDPIRSPTSHAMSFQSFSLWSVLPYHGHGKTRFGKRTAIRCRICSKVEHSATLTGLRSFHVKRWFPVQLTEEARKHAKHLQTNTVCSSMHIAKHLQKTLESQITGNHQNDQLL